MELAGIEGCDLLVKGADLLDGTPIYDIKPYLPYVDAHPRRPGRVHSPDRRLRPGRGVRRGLLGKVPKEKRAALLGVLKNDPPRPGYQHDPARVYTLDFGQNKVRFHGGRTNADGTGDS